MPHIALDRTQAEAAVTTTVGAPVPLNGMSLENFDDELHAMLIGRTDTSSTRRRLWINMAYSDLCTSLKLEEVRASIEIPLVADAFMYRLPSAVYAIIAASVIDDDEDPDYGGRPLEKSDLVAFRSHPLADSRPREYFKHGDMLVIWPTPEVAGSLVIDFWIRPTWMTVDAHCPILYSEWHEGILLKARHKAFIALQAYDQSMIANNDFVQFMRSRQDVRAIESETMHYRSSVPRSEGMLNRPRGRIPPHMRGSHG